MVDRSAARRRAPSAPNVLSTIPQPPRVYIDRLRFDDLVTTAATRPVTALIAPAGAGKTTSLARWATRPHAPPVHWLSAPLAQPVAALAAALTAAAHLPPPERIAAHNVERRALDLLAGPAVEGKPDVIIIDDAHLLPHAAWVLLETVIASTPHRVRIVLAGRRDLPLATAKFGLSDSVTVLRGDVLRFDDDEAGALVTAHAPDASAEDIRTLQGRAQGWAAALVLGARALFAAVDRPAARAEFTHTERPVLDYLLGEVFVTLPESAQHLLLCTCDEDSVTEAAAILLSGDTDAAARLSELATGGMLVTSYRGAGAQSTDPAWRFHPLLRELLRRQTAMGGPDHALGVAAHGRAAQHYAVHGPVPEAVRHAAAAGDLDLLVELLIEEGPGLITGGHEHELAAGLRALPDDVIAQHPALLGVLALARRVTGDIAAVNRLAEQAIRAAADVHRRLARPTGDVAAPIPAPSDLALVADAALLSAWQARFGWANYWDAVRVARGVLGCAAAHEAVAAQAGDAAEATHGHEHRWPLAPARAAWLTHELAAAEMWAGDLDAAMVHVGDTLVTAQALGHDRMVAGALANRALLEMLDARFQSAGATAERCIATAAGAGRIEQGQASIMSRAYLVRGWAAYYDIRFAAAAAALDEVELIESRASDPLVAILATVLKAKLRAEDGDFDGARRLLMSPPATPEPQPAYLVWMIAAAQADQALRAGDVAEVRRQAMVMRDAGASSDDSLFEWLLADLDGDLPGAVALIDRALRDTRSGQGVLVASAAASYRTRIYLRQGDLDAAEAMLRDALSRVAPQRLLYPLVRQVDSDPAFEKLLERVTGGPRPHAFAGHALTALHRYRFGYDDPAVAATVRAHMPSQRSSAADALGRRSDGRGESSGRMPANPMAVPLTDRESDVLRELALGGSYQDIARTLYVTENTVKTHLASLYRKLGADRRASALRRAREFGLL